MSVKLIMNWDVKPGKDQDYFEFVVREWVQVTANLGLQTVGAWFSIYSRNEQEPRMMVEALAEDLPTMRGILNSPEWEAIHAKLLEYVENYRQKVVDTSGDFQV